MGLSFYDVFFFFFNKRKRTITFYVRWIELLIIRVAGFHGNKDPAPFYGKYKKNSYTPAVGVVWAPRASKGTVPRIRQRSGQPRSAPGITVLEEMCAPKSRAFGQIHSKKWRLWLLHPPCWNPGTPPDLLILEEPHRPRPSPRAPRAPLWWLHL